MFSVATGITVGGGVVSWKADRDLVFLGAISVAMAAQSAVLPQLIISRNSKFTSGFWVQAGVGDAPILDQILFVTGPNTSATVTAVIIPVLKDETIFVAFNVGGWALLYFDENSAEK